MLPYLLLTCYVLILGPRFAISTETSSIKPDLHVKTIYIDPWYGGKESGPLFGPKKYGKAITFDIAQKLQSLLEASEFKVYLSREGDQDITLEERLFRGKAKGADLHLAIKLTQSKADCVRLLVASPPVQEPQPATETRDLKELDAQVNDMFMHLKAESIREESLLIAKTILDKFKKWPVPDCVKLVRGKDYILKNAEEPTVMVDFHISPANNQPSTIDNASLDKIAGLLADSLKEYSEQRSSKGKK